MAPKRTMLNSSDMEGTDEEEYEAKRSRKSEKRAPEEYRKRRDRNNVAVRKSRDKSRFKAKETMEKVSRLRNENEQLEQKVKILTKELSVLKDLFLAHAGTVAEGNCNVASNHAVQNDHKYSMDVKQE
ncbi:CCAAT/enhancer-binding protein gamma-like [Haliotis rubra]|uniref:CCAAT/enhancer-binding protein gamma-like n=1 Tax=Haliotis rubra TaxID=36100 RepID=UPI001EE5E9B7|nr:CCAAT/enhancer-binding protein gamma-like [Haliotis rubra]